MVGWVERNAKPIIRARQQTLNIVGVLDALESEIDTGTPPYVFRNSFDSLRVFRTGVDYAMSDIWAGNARPATTGVIFRMSQGINGLGADTNMTRPGERVDFFFDPAATYLFDPATSKAIAKSRPGRDIVQRDLAITPDRPHPEDRRAFDRNQNRCIRIGKPQREMVRRPVGEPSSEDCGVVVMIGNTEFGD